MSSLLGGAYSDSEHSDEDTHIHCSFSFGTPTEEKIIKEDELIQSQISTQQTTSSVQRNAEISISPSKTQTDMDSYRKMNESSEISDAGDEERGIHSTFDGSPSSSSDEVIIQKLEDSSITEENSRAVESKFGDLASVETDDIIDDIIDQKYFDMIPPMTSSAPMTENDTLTDLESQTFEQVQIRISKFLQTMEDEKCDFTESIKMKQEFGNPAVLRKICEHYSVNDKLSNYPKDVFNPTGYDLSDYYDNLASESRKRNREKQEMPPPVKNAPPINNRVAQWGPAVSVNANDTVDASISMARAKAAAADIAKKISSMK